MSNQNTTMVTKETVERKWYILDAAGKPMGKTAALAADLLRGKLKTDYTPNVDCGDREGRCSDRQEAGAEVLSHPFRLSRRSQRDQISDSDGEEARAGNAPCCSWHAPEEYDRPVAAQAPENFRRPGA